MLCKVEYHFNVDLRNARTELEFDKINSFLCALKIKIRRHEGSQGREFDTFDFGRSGLLHAKAIAARTIPGRHFSKLQEIQKLVKHLRPTILYLASEDDGLLLGPQFKKVQNNVSRYIGVHHDRIRIFGNIDIPIWLIQTKSGVNERDLRDLSLYLRRLHCEYEVLKVLLREIERGTIEVTEGHLAEDVEAYLREMLDRVKSSERVLARRRAFAEAIDSGAPSMLDLATVSVHDLDPTLYAEIENALRRVRFRWRSNQYELQKFLEAMIDRIPRVEFNVRELNLDQRQTVSNSSNVVLSQAAGDAQIRMDKSFNGLQDHAKNAELVQAVAALKSLLDQAIEKGDVKDPEVLARDFSEMADEAASTTPRGQKIRGIGHLLLGAIKDTSELVGSIGKAIEVVTKLLP